MARQQTELRAAECGLFLGIHFLRHIGSQNRQIRILMVMECGIILKNRISSLDSMNLNGPGCYESDAYGLG